MLIEKKLLQRRAALTIATLAMLSLGATKALALGSMAKASDYVPFLEEGKSWVVTYMTHENTSSYKRIYMVKGDTIIGDRLYKKLYEEDRGLYLYALREEGGKVYSLSSTDKYGEPNTEEVLWYDFSVKEGDMIDTPYYSLKVAGTDMVAVNGYLYKRIHLKWTYKSHPEYNGTGVWIEGIGSDLGPFSPYSWGRDRDGYHFMEECSVEGRSLFSHDDFTAPAWGGEQGVESAQTIVPQPSAATYDLQGRSLPQNKWSDSRIPKGIYIRDGRKVVM